MTEQRHLPLYIGDAVYDPVSQDTAIVTQEEPLVVEWWDGPFKSVRTAKDPTNLLRFDPYHGGYPGPRTINTAAFNSRRTEIYREVLGAKKTTARTA